MIIIKPYDQIYIGRENISDLHVATLIDRPGVILFGKDNVIIDQMNTIDTHILSKLRDDIINIACKPTATEEIYKITEDHKLLQIQ